VGRDSVGRKTVKKGWARARNRGGIKGDIGRWLHFILLSLDSVLGVSSSGAQERKKDGDPFGKGQSSIAVFFLVLVLVLFVFLVVSHRESRLNVGKKERKRGKKKNKEITYKEEQQPQRNRSNFCVRKKERRKKFGFGRGGVGHWENKQTKKTKGDAKAEKNDHEA